VLAIGIDRRALVAAPGRAAAPGERWDAATLRDACAAAIGSHRGPVQLVLGSDLCRHFVQQPPAGVRRLDELRQVSALRAARLFGGAADDWALAADWDSTKPFVCAALEAELLDALRGAVTTRQRPLRVHSALVLALQRLWPRAAPATVLAWSSPAATVMATLAGGAVAGLRCLARDAGAAATEAQTCIAEAARVELEALREARRVEQAPGPVVFASTAEVRLPERPAWRWFDARRLLPGHDGSEAAWACRLAGMPGGG
jgi:hypothetical protein